MSKVGTSSELATSSENGAELKAPGDEIKRYVIRLLLVHSLSRHEKRRRLVTPICRQRTTVSPPVDTTTKFKRPLEVCRVSPVDVFYNLFGSNGEQLKDTRIS